MTPMPAPQSVGTREKILEAAARCLVHFGLSKTTMHDVSRQAGVSRASVYRYFADRNELIEAAIRRQALSFLEDNLERLRRWPTFGERLVEGITDDVSRGVADPLMRLVSEEPAEASSLIGRPRLYGELTYLLWEPVLADAQESGDLRAGLEPTDVANWIARLEVMFMSQFEETAAAKEEIRGCVRTFVVPAIVSTRGQDRMPTP